MRLINADDVAMAKVPYDDELSDYEKGWNDAVIAISENAETVDAVKVVRCKDCEYYTEEERWCRRLGLCGAFDQNGYCSHAERRTDEGEKTISNGNN